MSPLRARVEKGRLVLDEPTTLPEGMVVDLVADDEGDDLTNEERCALHEALSTSITWRSFGLSNQQKSLLLKMWIDRESLGHASLAHHNERYGVNQAEQSPAPIEQHVEPRVVKCFIDPHHIDERREVRPKAPDGIKTQAPGNKRIRFHQNIGCRQEQSLPGTQVSEGTLRAGMIVICLVE